MGHKAMLCLFVLVLAGTTGCGKGSGVTTVKVTGTVTYLGKPVEGTTVAFLPQHGPAAGATTDSQGRFALTTVTTGDGAVPGSHKVLIADPTTNAKVDKATKGLQRAPSRFPDKYGNPQTSPFTADVKENATNDFTFDMTN